jgi:hypothetical protein
MDKERLQELAGVQLNEAEGKMGDVYAATFDSGDGTYLGIVGPFATSGKAKGFFKEHKEFEDIRFEIDDVMSPQEYLETFRED